MILREPGRQSGACRSEASEARPGRAAAPRRRARGSRAAAASRAGAAGRPPPPPSLFLSRRRRRRLVYLQPPTPPRPPPARERRRAPEPPPPPPRSRRSRGARTREGGGADEASGRPRQPSDVPSFLFLPHPPLLLPSQPRFSSLPGLSHSDSNGGRRPRLGPPLASALSRDGRRPRGEGGRGRGPERRRRRRGSRAALLSRVRSDSPAGRRRKTGRERKKCGRRGCRAGSGRASGLRLLCAAPLGRRAPPPRVLGSLRGATSPPECLWQWPRRAGAPNLCL